MATSQSVGSFAIVFRNVFGIFRQSVTLLAHLMFNTESSGIGRAALENLSTLSGGMEFDPCHSIMMHYGSFVQINSRNLSFRLSSSY